MVFNAPFNAISVISWRLVLLVKGSGMPGETMSLLSLYYVCFTDTLELVINCPEFSVDNTWFFKNKY
jgi:hypothetical protein